MLLEDVLKDERDVFYFQIQSTIKSYRRSYYLGCPYKSCNKVVTNRKFSECKKCKEQIIPKNVLKLQINLGTTEAILWCISFNNVAERLIDYIESNTPLFFRITSRYFVSTLGRFKVEISGLRVFIPKFSTLTTTLKLKKKIKYLILMKLFLNSKIIF
jgi:hypothetical protein